MIKDKYDGRVSSTPMGQLYRIRVDDIIDGVHDYREELDVLYNAQPEDVVVIYVNTDGGHFNTCVSICNAIESCQAHVTTVLEGKANSAGGPILLSGDNIVVMPNTGMMIHQAYNGTEGKINDNLKYLKFINEQVDRFYRRGYANFLTEQELDSVLKGDDIWLHDDEIITRLEKRAELFEQELLEESIDDIVEEPAPTPPPKRKRSQKGP